MINSNSKIGGDAIKLLVSRFIAMLISMISAMLLSRFRTLSEYGTYSQILMTVNITTTIIMIGLPNSINYFLAKEESINNKARFLSVYYTLSTFLSMLAGFALILLTPQIVKYFENNSISNFWYVLAFYPWTKVIMSSIENILIVYKKTSLIIIYRFTNSVFLLGALVVAQMLKFGFAGYMVFFILVEIFFTILVYAIVKKINCNFRLLFDIQLVKAILAFSLPIGLASIVGTINIELDKLMIGKFLNTEQLAIYTNAAREMPVSIIAMSLTAVLLPRIVVMLKKGDTLNTIKLWGNSIKLSYILICFLVSGFFTYAPDVMTLLYSEKYLTGVTVFRIYNVALLLRITYFGIILNAKGKTKFIFYSSILSLLLNGILNLVLFKFLGFIGPAIATLLSQATINFIQLIFTSKLLSVPLRQLFPWRDLIHISILNVILSILFNYLKQSIPLESYLTSAFESLLLGVVWAFIYLGISAKKIKKEWHLFDQGGY